MSCRFCCAMDAASAFVFSARALFHHESTRMMRNTMPTCAKLHPAMRCRAVLPINQKQNVIADEVSTFRWWTL
jgi:hypothetical protein